MAEQRNIPQGQVQRPLPKAALNTGAKGSQGPVGIGAPEREVPLRDEPHVIHESNEVSREEMALMHEPYDESWTPPMLTSAPPPLPGMVQRWVRVKLDGLDDPSNVSRSLMEGWTPRPAETVQKGFFAPVVSFGQHGNVIGNSDSVLMHRPVKVQEGYDRYYKQLTDRQQASIKQNVRGAMPGQHGVTPGEVDEFNVKTSRGRRPKLADDD